MRHLSLNTVLRSFCVIISFPTSAFMIRFSYPLHFLFEADQEIQSTMVLVSPVFKGCCPRTQSVVCWGLFRIIYRKRFPEQKRVRSLLLSPLKALHTHTHRHTHTHTQTHTHCYSHSCYLYLRLKADGAMRSTWGYWSPFANNSHKS